MLTSSRNIDERPSKQKGSTRLPLPNNVLASPIIFIKKVIKSSINKCCRYKIFPWYLSRFNRLSGSSQFIIQYFHKNIQSLVVYFWLCFSPPYSFCRGWGYSPVSSTSYTRLLHMKYAGKIQLFLLQQSEYCEVSAQSADGENLHPHPQRLSQRNEGPSGVHSILELERTSLDVIEEQRQVTYYS